MRCAVYQIETGEILRIVVCPARSMSAQSGPGEAACEVAADVQDDTHRIVDGQAVEKE